MKINVFTSPAEIGDDDLRGEMVVVIDVLRASSTILQALVNGCREIIPVESVERALSLHSALFDSDVLLCGERGGIKINGFDMGNSPVEYTRERVAGRPLIFSSTNGSAAFVKVQKSKPVYVCGFQNIGRIVAMVQKEPEILNILCSGQYNHLSLEDAVCAGMLIHQIEDNSKVKHDLTDGALTAFQLYRHYGGDLKAFIRMAGHGRELIELGMEGDLDFCVEVDSIPLLPVYADGKIRKSGS